MPERLDSKLESLNAHLRFFGKWDEANAVALLTRLCCVHDIDSLEKLEAFVNDEDKFTAAAQGLIAAVTP